MARSCERTEVKRTNKSWTKQEDDYLRQTYESTRSDVIAKTMCRSRGAVYARAQFLCLAKSKELIDEHISFLIEAGKKHGAQTRFKPKHGKAGIGDRTYCSWKSMLHRCNNPKHKSYKDYGGRGISICDRWVNSFQSFYDDMGDVPKGKTLGRIDNNSGYEPSNCEWQTPIEQGRNRRGLVILKAFDEERCASEWAERFGIRLDTFLWRVRNSNVSVETALTTPVGHLRKSR
jgi:hypothetical protein